MRQPHPDTPEHDLEMTHVLTSWKQIAQYVDKGVRTVQRWERELGFPVRRPERGSRNVIFAFREEIDAWVTQQTKQRDADDPKSELARLRKELHELRAEIKTLRQQLEAVQESTPAEPQPRR